jgi:hypothetical protein
MKKAWRRITALRFRVSGAGAKQSTRKKRIFAGGKRLIFILPLMDKKQRFVAFIKRFGTFLFSD